VVEEGAGAGTPVRSASVAANTASDVVDASSGLEDAQNAHAGLDRARIRTVWVSGQESEWDDSIILTVVVEPGYADEARSAIRDWYAGPLCVLERDLPPTSELRAVQEEVMGGPGRPSWTSTRLSSPTPSP